MSRFRSAATLVCVLGCLGCQRIFPFNPVVEDAAPADNADGVGGDMASPSPGSLDPRFGEGGFAAIPVSATTADLAKRLGLDSQGRIVVGGQTIMTGPGNDLFFARCLPDGALDTTFGSGPVGGVVTLDLFGGQDGLFGMVVDSADRIIGGGETASGDPSDLALSLVRLLPDDGALDLRFADNGKLAHQVTNGNDQLQGLVIDSAGRLVFSGRADERLLLVGRAGDNGAIDTSFAGGVLTTNIGGLQALGMDVAMASGDRVVVAGRCFPGTGTGNDVAVVRYTPDGSPDPTFGTTGEVLVDLSRRDDLAASLAVDAEDRVLVTGRSIGSDETTAKIFVLRLLKDGTLDLGFGDNGSLLLSAGSDAWGRAVLLDTQQRIIVTGEAMLPGGRDLVILRLTPEGQLDPAFGQGGFVTTDLGGRDESTRHAILDEQGRLLVVGWFHDGPLADSFIARFLM